MIIWILSFLFVSKRCGSWNPMGFWTSKFCKTLRLQDFITDENQEFEHRISAAASETRSFGNPVIRRSWCFTKKTHRKMRHYWPWRSFLRWLGKALIYPPCVAPIFDEKIEACGFGSIMALPIEQCTQCFLAIVCYDPGDDLIWLDMVDGHNSARLM